MAEQVGTLLLTDLVIYAWHQLPIVGRAAGPVMHFLNMVEGLGLRRAAVISLLGLWGPLQWWIFQFVRLWRASRVCFAFAPLQQAFPKRPLDGSHVRQ